MISPWPISGPPLLVAAFSLGSGTLAPTPSARSGELQNPCSIPRMYWTVNLPFLKRQNALQNQTPQLGQLRSETCFHPWTLPRDQSRIHSIWAIAWSLVSGGTVVAATGSGLTKSTSMPFTSTSGDPSGRSTLSSSSTQNYPVTKPPLTTLEPGSVLSELS